MATKRYLSLFLLVGMASAQHCRKIDIDKSSGFCTVPDPKLTRGEMDASLACVSNGDRPRREALEPRGLRIARKALRNLLASSTIGCLTGMGGSDTAKNRCFEPHTGKFSLLSKNEAELLLWRNVCVNKTMTLDQVKKTYLRGFPPS